ncbi:hypothetical protein F5144DRAFT_497245 [Chaetomium tenue]|uniref:Uncharacterized protein n=1 Tax=Chaetomium tenue TaxID=1854479 RepID=A0ACB7NY91_9PEZI|nr:hypothetical protein F5144DRAFT_497245 [Chaetomium globosum]
MMLLKVLDVRWQRVVTWGLAISANLIIWGFAIFLWVVIWQDRLVQICIEASGIWRLAIFGAASIPVLRHIIEKPAQAAFERGLMGTRSGSGLPRDFAYPSSAPYGRRAKIWSTGGGPIETPIPLETLGSTGGILRTDEVNVDIEEKGRDSHQKKHPHNDHQGQGKQACTYTSLASPVTRSQTSHRPCSRNVSVP